MQFGETGNIAAYLPWAASESPGQRAVVFLAGRGPNGRPLYDHVTLQQLEARSNRYANGLRSVGIESGTRTLVMVRPGVDFIALIFALFKMGAVPILIDPGMGISRLLECVRHVEAQAFVGVPLAHLARFLMPSSFRTVRTFVTVGPRSLATGPTLADLCRKASTEFGVISPPPEDPAAILFTSGATGPAKGVVYRHSMFHAQVEIIRSEYGIEPGEIDLPTFPLFSLFNPALGMTSVIPPMNPSRPAKADPARLVQVIQDQRVTNSFGSPALWDRVSRYCLDRGLMLPSIRRILVAGAPVRGELVERLMKVLSPGAEIHTPYGATEALPVTTIRGTELLNGLTDESRRGAGICVGKPVAGINVDIVPITDQAIESWTDDLRVSNGTPGEIVASGPIVTEEYFGLPTATHLAKIRNRDRVYHRMGDIGYRDESGRLWFCGRKAHRVVTSSGTLFTIPCEAIFNEHQDIFRSALVGVGPKGRQVPVIIIEPLPGRFPNRHRATAFAEELMALGRQHEHTRSVTHILFHRSFPVDVRHNAKINREALAAWAERRVQG